ncbi:hypothetical protein Scep_020063 [Stephania cephalantha]|uniref:Uncharacterized protein n=1 Tax=Stephania cephalantha TaxID=152367 RepID=A0AAP0IBZ4_9MAGN
MADQPEISDTGPSDVYERLNEMSKLVTSHGQQIQEILQLLRAQATSSLSTSAVAAPATQGGSAPTV